MSEIIEKHIEELRQHRKLDVELIEADGLNIVIIKGYPLPGRYSKASSDLMIRLDKGYPNSKPDMFWLEEDVLLKDGAVPDKAEQILESLGKKWRRFSWHFNTWNPATGNLLGYVEFIDVRLNKSK